MSTPKKANNTAAGRLSRLLSLVPWLSAHPGVTIPEAAEHFGVSEKQLVEDLNLLICTGRPGHQHQELVDIQFWDEDGVITVLDPQTIGRPLRFSADEAASLLVALRLLAAVPGPHDRDAIASAQAKLEAAAGEARAAAEGVVVQVDATVAPEVETAVRAALEDGRRLHITYIGALDDRTERDVDPLRIVALDGRVYLEGWCHRAEAMRTFRLDRIVAAEVLGDAADVPADAVPLDLGAGVLRPQGGSVTLVLDRSVRWIAEEFPVDSVQELPDGRLQVVLPVADERWLVRLLLRSVPSVQVVDRPDVAERVRAEAAAALAAYPA